MLYQTLPPKEAGLLAGMVLGDKTGFESSFWTDLKQSGVVHIVVVSGSNIMLLTTFLVENMAKFIGRKKAIILGLITAWSYTNMVGWEAPVIRAVLLISVYYWAQILGRKYSISRSLGLTILIMLLADWKMVTGISFWLSFLAFLAIVLKPKVEGRTILKDAFMTLWVSLWVTPILAISFGKISLISFLTNALVLMLVEIVTLWGGLGMIIGVFCQFLGKIILFLIFPFLKYFVVIVEVMGKLSWASVDVKFNWMMLV
ncbi:MAG: ComEC/Rec2 family competence protein, partial [Candidatus Shapirobacteria bacterium]